MDENLNRYHRGLTEDLPEWRANAVTARTVDLNFDDFDRQRIGIHNFHTCLHSLMGHSSIKTVPSVSRIRGV